MNMADASILMISLAIMACSSGKVELPGKYVVEGEVSKVANLQIFPDNTYTLCVDGCERGRLLLHEGSGDTVRVRFYGKKMEGYAREVFAKVVGSEMVTSIEGPPTGMTEMNVETGVFGTSLMLEPASNVIFRKVSSKPD